MKTHGTPRLASRHKRESTRPSPISPATGLPALKILVAAVMTLWSGGAALAQQGIQINTNAAAASAQNLPSTRARPRQMIEGVVADQPGTLDMADTLGNQLNPSQQKQRQQLWLEREQASKSATEETLESQAQTSRQQATLLQWPTLSSPTNKRLLAREDTTLKIEGEKPVFTPDFSRQRLTLATIANRVVVDLPQQDMVDPGAKLKSAPISPDKQLTMNLPDLVGIGLSYSPVMDQVQAQLENAIALTKQARADLLPRFSARLARGPERSITTTGTNDHTTQSATRRLTQPLINLPLISDWQASLSGERAANWRLQATRETVALAVTQATINLATARIILDYSDEQLAQFTQLLEYVQARTQTGATSAADLERTRTRVLLARQVRIEQQAQYKNALLELARLTGQTPDALQLPYLNQLPALPATQGEMRRVAWDFSYDLRALREEIQAQRKVVQSQQGKLLPVLGLSVERDTSQNVRGVNAQQTDQRVLAVMTWDISLAGKELYGVKAASSELSNREAKLTEAGERMLQSMDGDFASLQSATLRVTAGRAEQFATAVVVESVNAQMRSGRLGSLLEALDAYERHFAARQRVTLTLGQQMQAQAQLLQRMGLLSQIQERAQVDLAPRITSESPAVGAALIATPPNTLSTTPPATPPTKAVTQPL